MSLELYVNGPVFCSTITNQSRDVSFDPRPKYSTTWNMALLRKEARNQTTLIPVLT